MAINKTKSGHFMVDFRDQSKRRLQQTFPTYREAKAFQKAVLNQVEKREYFRPTQKTVGELAEEWYQRKVASGTYRYSALRSWGNHVERYVKADLGNIRVDTVTVSTIEKVAAEWGNRVGAKSVNKVLTTLTAVMAMAKRHDLRRDNPAAEAERIKVATEEEGQNEIDLDKVYTKDELKSLIGATQEGSRERILVMVLALTGLRIGELLALDWDGIDFKAPALDVRQNLSDSAKGDDFLFQAPKTKSSKRRIPLPQELVRELRIWKLKCPRSEKDLVLPTEEGKPYFRKTVSKILDRVIDKAEVKRLTPHGLRHTFASLLLADRRPVTEVAYLMGHKDSSVTLKVYAHFVRTETGAVQALAASILGGGK